jgi:hypothetical protein
LEFIALSNLMKISKGSGNLLSESHCSNFWICSAKSTNRGQLPLPERAFCSSVLWFVSRW